LSENIAKLHNSLFPRGQEDEAKSAKNCPYATIIAESLQKKEYFDYKVLKGRNLVPIVLQ